MGKLKDGISSIYVSLMMLPLFYSTKWERASSRLSVPVWVCSAAGNVSVPSRPVSSQRTETLIQLPSFRQLLACTAVTCLIPLLLQLTVLPGDGTGTVCYSVFPLSLTQWSPGYCAVNHYEAVLRLLVSH